MSKPLGPVLVLAAVGYMAYVFGPSVMAPEITTGTVTVKRVYEVRPDPTKPARHEYVFQLSDGHKVSDVRVNRKTYDAYREGQHYLKR